MSSGSKVKKQKRVVDSFQLAQQNHFLISRKEIQCLVETKGIYKKQSLNFVENSENFIFKFLTMQGIIALVGGVIGGLVWGPLAPIGIAVGCAAGLAYGAYSTKKEHEERNGTEDEKTKTIKTLIRKNTFVDYLNSPAFNQMLNKIALLKDVDIDELEEKLFPNHVLKGKLTSLKSKDDLRGKFEKIKTDILQGYVKKQSSNKSPANVDPTYVNKTRLVIGGFALATAFPGFAAITTGLVFGGMVIGGLVTSSLLTGGISLIAVGFSLIVGAVVAGAFYYGKKKRDARVAERTAIVNSLEKQHQAVEGLDVEVDVISKKIDEINSAKPAEELRSAAKADDELSAKMITKMNFLTKRRYDDTIFSHERVLSEKPTAVSCAA